MTASPALSHDAPDFRALFESAPGSYLVLTSDLQIVAANESYLKTTMTRREEIVGQYLFDVFPENPEAPDTAAVANFTGSIQRVVENRLPDAMAVQRYDLRNPDIESREFEERHWAVINSPVIAADGHVAFVISRVEDLTEFVRLKKASTQSAELKEAVRNRTYQAEAELYLRATQLAEANRLRLDSLGRMAGGVAHDFSNLLNIVLGYTKLLQSESHDENSIKTGLSAIERAAETAVGLTRQLLAFSRQQVLEPRVISPNELIGGIETLIKSAIGSRIRLEVTLDPKLDRVRVDPTQFEQVILNLVMNARDAMPKGGELIIVTKNMALDEAYVLEHPGVPAGQYVAVEVSDTGLGIRRELQSQIFEPFFTTKKGKGTGLGLSTVYGIVRQSGGHVSVYSELGMGTSFRVYLPAVTSSSEEPRRVPQETSAMGQGETILLVEDQTSLRELFETMLGRSGYRVLSAGSPADALNLARSHEGPISLLISDVVLPEMNGPEFAERFGEIHPESRALFVSAFTESVISRQGKLKPGTNFLQKPVSHSDLAKKVREILSQSRIGESGPRL